MLILKKAIAFIVIVAMLSSLGGFIFYIIYNIMFHDKYGSNRYFENVEGVFLALVFIYVANLFLYALWRLAKKPMISRSLSAFLLTVLFWMIVSSLTWGLDLKGISLVVVSVAVPSFVLNFIMERVEVIFHHEV